jgi:hypothetical protein
MGGMSVSPDAETILEKLPHRLPERLAQLAFEGKLSDRAAMLVRGAIAKKPTILWSMGEGAFTSAPLTDRLALRIDPGDERHGLVEPDAVMSLVAYQDALRETVSMWSAHEWEAVLAAL